MKLWKKAAGLVKDRNSLLAASISRRSSYRNPDLESIVIKATSHDDSHVNYKNFHLVYKWLRTSPMNVKPLMHAISSRMEKTRSWVVALKGLMLMHGVLCCKIPAVKLVGRLPFDLSKFHDGNSLTPSMSSRRYESFVRAYFAYLDRKSRFLISRNATLTFKKKHEERDSLMEEIEKVRESQELMGILLRMRPEIDTAKVYLVFEAMICVLTEVFDVYSRICKEIARLLTRVYAERAKEEAKMALEVVEKAVVQAEELESYLEYCRVLGLVGSSERVEIKHISKEEIRDLERIIYEANYDDHDEVKEIIKEDKNCDLWIVVGDDDDQDERGKEIKKVFRTKITDKWEVFNEEGDMMGCVSSSSSSSTSDYYDANVSSYTNPFLTSSSSLIPYDSPVRTNKPVLPDLITF